MGNTTDDERRVRQFYAAIAAVSDHDVHGHLQQGDGTAFGIELHDEYVLQIPSLGIEISGGDASLSWLRSDVARRGATEIIDLRIAGPFAVVFLRHRDEQHADDEALLAACHVLRFDGDQLRSCCVIPA